MGCIFRKFIQTQKLGMYIKLITVKAELKQHTSTINVIKLELGLQILSKRKFTKAKVLNNSLIFPALHS
jgi:hypothetical protein